MATVQVLLDHGADPNIKNCRDETALDLAALYGRVETVALLLEKNPELVGPYTAYGGAMYSHTPLHLASRNGHREIVEQILAKGFDINVRTARGTALHEAAMCGKVDVVRTLLSSNVNVELRNQDNKTVLDLLDDLKTPVSNDIIHIILGKRLRHLDSMQVWHETSYCQITLGCFDTDTRLVEDPTRPCPRTLVAWTWT